MVKIYLKKKHLKIVQKKDCDSYKNQYTLSHEWIANQGQIFSPWRGDPRCGLCPAPRLVLATSPGAASSRLAVRPVRAAGHHGVQALSGGDLDDLVVAGGSLVNGGLVWDQILDSRAVCFRNRHKIFYFQNMLVGYVCEKAHRHTHDLDVCGSGPRQKMNVVFGTANIFTR